MGKTNKDAYKRSLLKKPRPQAHSSNPTATVLAAIAASPLLTQPGGPALEWNKTTTFDRENRKLGLGINFYDDKGNLKATTRPKTLDGGEDEDKGETIAKGDVVGQRGSGSGSGSGSSSETCTATTIEAQRAKVAANLAACRRSADTGGSHQDTISHINQLLEENYRKQAETFVRRVSRTSSSSASIRPFTRSHSGGSASAQGKSPLLPESKPTLPTIEQSGQIEHTRQLFSIRQSSSIRTPSGTVIVQPYSIRNSSLNPSLTAANGPSSYAIYGHRLLLVPTNAHPGIIKQSHQSHPENFGADFLRRSPFYFTTKEREAIAELVLAKSYNCAEHTNCTDCREIEYSFFENKIMPTSIPPDDRQKIINSNRSLRNIKNELENLAENGAISDDVYDTIMRSLPAEASLNGPASRSNTAPPPPAAPVNASSNAGRTNDPPPPAYTSQTPPSLPSRSQTSPPELSRVVALYRYAEPDDCNFEVGDEIAVYKHMNVDWWHGKNIRTGKEGVFPVNYVQEKSASAPPAATQSSYGNEKANAYPGAYQQQQQGPPPPGPSNPYKSSVPPMQIASQPSEGKPGKGGEMGKKFGKKLGNAAIFGAGASIGGKIVNGIF